MIVALPVNVAMDPRQETPSGEIRRIPFHRLLEKTRGLRQFLAGLDLVRCVGVKSARPRNQIERFQIGCRRSLQRGPLAGRKFCPKLIRDGFRDLALNGEYIGQVAIVMFGPNMHVGPGIDELSGHAHALALPLHAPFQDVSDAEFAPDLTQIARTGFVLKHARSAHDFQVRYARQLGQDVVVHAFSEIGVLLVVASIFEGKHRDAFLRDRHSRRARERRLRLRAGPRFPRMQKLDHIEHRDEGFRPVRCVIESSRGTSWVRFSPSGVISKIHAKTSITGSPMSKIRITRRTAQFGISNMGKTCVAI